MQENTDKLKALYKRYLGLTIVSLFLMALLQGLHSFFLTIFFWLSLGFGLLSLNYFIAEKRAAQPNVSWDRKSSPSKSFEKRRKIIIPLVIGAMVFLLFISILVSIFSSSGDRIEQESTTTTVEEGDSKETTDQHSTEYQLAADESNNQNYRQSIALCRKGLVNQPGNLDFILLLGDNYGSLKQYDSSYIWFNKAYQLGARSAYLSHWMGYFYDEKGEISRAIEFYKDALKQDSTRTQIYDRLAELEPNRAEWYKAKSAQWKSN